MTGNSLPLLFPIMVGAMFGSTAHHANAEEPLVFISAFAAGDEGAIHAFRLNTESGRRVDGRRCRVGPDGPGYRSFRRIRR